jgi:hypothetical protein
MSRAAMAQLFDRGLLLALKLTALIGAIVLFAGVFCVAPGDDYPHQIGASPTQLLPFSYLHVVFFNHRPDCGPQSAGRRRTACRNDTSVYRGRRRL